MKSRKRRSHITLLVLCSFFCAGYLALAQEREGAERAQESAAEAQSVETAIQESQAASGVADGSVVVNFSKLAVLEAQSPDVYREPKEIDEPGPGPRHKAAPVEAGAVLEEERPEAFAATTEPLAASPPLLSNFRALDDNNASIPPDTHGAAGPNHLMVVHNTQIRIQTRAGATLSTVSLNSFWSALPGPWAGVGPATFDPKVLYDPYSNRWMFTVTADGDEATSAVLIAVSQTSDPTGSWRLYKVDVDSTGAAWADYPSIGFNKNWIVVTVNMFGVGGTGFKRSNIYAFNKANLYAGTGSFMVFTDANGFTMAPAITYDNALNTLYLVEDWDGATQLRVSSLTGTAAAPAYSTTHTFPTAPAASAWTSSPPGGADFAPQLGSAVKIQNNDSRMQNVVYRNGSLWCAQTVFLPSGASATRSAIQWWQLTTAGAITQRGRVDDSTGQKFYAFPSIAVNKNSDVLVGYSRFSGQIYAGSAYSFRGQADPVNTLRTEAGLKAGSDDYYKTFSGTRNRWGDYSSTVVDPVNDLDMWTIQEHADLASGGVSRWGTWWGRVGPSTPAPLIQLGTVTATDSGGDPDATIEPGEGGRLTVQLKNVGNGAASAVSANLTTATTGVTITTGSSAYPNLAATTGAGANTTQFAFSVASTVPCGALLSFTLTVTYTGGGSPAVLNFKVPTGNVTAAVTKTWAGPAAAIPDNTTTGVNIPLTVSGFTGRITDLNFKFGGTSCTTNAGATTVGLDHTWVGDLVVTLKSPAGTVVTLINQAGGVNNSGHNFCNTLLDDESTGGSIQSVTAAQAPYAASFKPAAALSAFDGQDANGAWTLHVEDRGPADTGSVRNFSLIITPTACSTTDALLQLGAVTATDGGGDPDVNIEPGENGNHVTVQLRNVGNGAASAVTGKLTTATTGVTITTATSAYPNLAATTGAGTNTTPFAFNVASTVPCGSFISFTLTVTYTGGVSPAVFTFKVPTGKAGTGVGRTWSGPAVAIPDNTTAGVSIPLTVSGYTGRIADLNFKFGGTTCTTAAGATTVGLNHTWVGNLVATLKSPAGTVVTILSQPGGAANSGHNFCNTLLDDESTGGSIQTITSAQAPYAASFKPANPLSAFDGQDPNGTWTLVVSDRAATNTGSVRTFILGITTYACSTTASIRTEGSPGGYELASASLGGPSGATACELNAGLPRWLRPMTFTYLDGEVTGRAGAPAYTF
jgi:subtilisin-like proprotein convertase family protein